MTIQVWKRFLAALVILAVAALACSAPGGPSSPEVTAAPSGPALDVRLLIWFAPLPPMEIREGRPFIGSDDFMDLFTTDAPWATAASHVGVFKLYGEWVSEDATDAELKQAVEDLNRREIAIAFEAGPLPYNTGCGEGIEGFAGIEEGLKIARRIKAAGGTVQFLAFDEPFAFGHFYDGPRACHWSAEKIAQETVRYVEAMRTIFPDVIAGDIEPLWPDADLDQYMEWIEAYEKVSGEPLAFFHLDVDWSRQTWPDDALQLETFARDHGVEFGMIYFGDWEDTSDEEWLGKAQDRITTYESLKGGRPDHVIIQSWHDHPDRALPETTPNTFTYFLNRYFRTRTALTLEAGWIDDSSADVGGSLTDEDGNPLAGQPVRVTVSPLDGSGVLGTISLTGTVPEGATQANVGFRVNTECDCSGPSSFSLYEARYAEGGADANLVANPDFAAGLGGWDSWGDIRAMLQASDQGAGSMMRIEAAPGQSLGVNSGLFPVSAGASFEVTFTARVAPESVGSGYFAIFFLSPDTEVSRERLPFAPAPAAEVSVTTDSDGSFSIPVSSLTPGRYQIDASFGGTAELRPAMTRAALPPR